MLLPKLQPRTYQLMPPRSTVLPQLNSLFCVMSILRQVPFIALREFFRDSP